MLDALGRCHICRYIKKEQLQDFMDAGSMRMLTAGMRLFDEGEAGESMFVILAGGVTIKKRGDDGQELTLTSLGPGEIVGEMSMVDRQPRSAAAVVFADATLFELNRTQLVQLAKLKPDITTRLLLAVVEAISMRLRQAAGQYQALLARTLASGDASPGIDL